MKKLKVLICVATLSFSLSACGSTVNSPTAESQSVVESSSESTPESNSEESSIASEIVSSNPLMNAEVLTADVMNGTNTEKIGTRAYVEISKTDLSSISDSDYSEFIDAAVSGSGYNWFSIICDDGTGITFTGSSAEIADYGKVDTEGRVTEVIGYIILQGGSYSYKAAE